MSGPVHSRCSMGPPLGPMRFADIPSYFWAAVEERPEHKALVDATTGRQLTYSELGGLVLFEMNRLCRMGIARGDRLAIVLPNGIAWIVAAMAAMSLGAAVTAANPQLMSAEIERDLFRVSPRAVVMPTELAAEIRGRGRIGSPVCFVLGAETLEESPCKPFSGAPPLPESLADEPALMPFSSGTSGLSKPVILSHRAFSATATQLLSVFGITREDVLLGLAPCFHIVGLMTVGATFAAGAKLVTVARYDPETLMAAIARYGISIAVVAPPVLRAFADHPAAAQHDISSLRAVTAGGAPVPQELQMRAAERIGCPVMQGYGMTETSGTISMGLLIDPRPGSCGRLLPGMQARIVDPDSGTERGFGEEGEVWVRGPNLMNGYFGDVEVTAATMTADGWLRTGDIGRIDADDTLYVCDRLKDSIKVHAFQVAPAELEAILSAHRTLKTPP